MLLGRQNLALAIILGLSLSVALVGGEGGGKKAATTD